eukprot:RCo045866
MGCSCCGGLFHLNVGQADPGAADFAFPLSPCKRSSVNVCEARQMALPGQVSDEPTLPRPPPSLPFVTAPVDLIRDAPCPTAKVDWKAFSQHWFRFGRGVKKLHSKLPGRIRKRAPDDARLLKYVDFGTAAVFSDAMGYARDSVVRGPDEELNAMSLEWASKELQPHWAYATHPVPQSPKARLWNGEVRDTGHEGWTLATFLNCPQARAAGLASVHVAALRLYTGPGFVYINADLRELRGAFPITVRVCMSAITMLATAAAAAGSIPAVFLRGLKGALEQQFVDAYRLLHQSPAGEGEMDRFLFGHALCDLALTSTTADVKVAAESFGGNILLVITPLPLSYGGALGLRGLPCGAEVGWVSQYPQEAEWLFPCGTMFYPVPRSERLPALPFAPPPEKLVLQLYACAPELKQHPKHPHAYYLAEESQRAAERFTTARFCLKHNLSLTVFAGLSNIVPDTLCGKVGIEHDKVVYMFSPLSILRRPEGSPPVVLCGAMAPLLMRFYECVVELSAAQGRPLPSHLKTCIELFRGMWLALPQNKGLDQKAFQEAWASMQCAVIAKLPKQEMKNAPLG